MCVASRSLPLDKARQALLDDIIALYSCEPTIERVKRYTPDCVYDDQFVYANDRYCVLQYSLVPCLQGVSYKMAGQWFALPKLFKASKNEGYQVVRSDDEVIQFKNEQVQTALIFFYLLRLLLTNSSPGPSRSFPRPPRSTPSSPSPSTQKPCTATSSASSTIKIKQMTRITVMRALGSHSRSGKRIRSPSTWIRRRLLCLRRMRRRVRSM